MHEMPGVDARLQIVAQPQLLADAGRKVRDKAGEAAPELFRRDARSGQNLAVDEVLEIGRDADRSDLRVSHQPLVSLTFAFDLLARPLPFNAPLPPSYRRGEAGASAEALDPVRRRPAAVKLLRAF